MKQETIEKTSGIRLQYKNILNDSYVLEHGEQAAFVEQYHQASKVVCEAVENAKCVPEGEFRHHSNNVIAFMGERGTGKTSAMISFQNALKSYNPVYPQGQEDCSKIFPTSREFEKIVEDSRYITLPCIDANAMKEKDDVIEIILARMLNHLTDFVQNASTRTRAAYQEKLRNLYQKFDTVFRNYRYLENANPKCVPEGEPALRTLQYLSSSQSVTNAFAELVRDYLGFFDWENENQFGGRRRKSFLVVALDDIDRYYAASKNAALKNEDVYTLVEQIYDYLMIPRVIVLLTTTDSLLRKSCRNHLVRQYDLPESEVLTLTNQFITKILPSHHIVRMPDFEHSVWNWRFAANQALNVILSEEIAQKFGLPQEVSAKKLALYLLAAKTNLYFDAAGVERHFFEQKNIRDAHDFFKLLDQMEDGVLSDPMDLTRIQNSHEILEYITSTFYSERLQGKELALFEDLLSEPIDRRSERLLNLLSSGRYQRLNEGYSYGTLLYYLYEASRSMGYSKNFVHCILALYTAELGQLYASCAVMQGEDARMAHKAMLHVMGTSVSGYWTNKMLPQVQYFAYSDISKVNEPYQVDDFWARNIKNLENIWFVHVDYPEPEHWKEAVSEIVRAAEMQLMLFTKLKCPEEDEQFGFEVSDNRPEPKGRLTLAIKTSTSANFNVFNFCVNSFDWEAYFDQVDRLLLDAFKTYFEKVHPSAGNFSVSELRNVIKKASFRRAYAEWALEYGPLALPIQQFDLLYNVFKRLADPNQNGMPKGISNNKILGYCYRLYRTMADRLEEQGEYYKEIPGSPCKFREAFENCPFVREVSLAQQKAGPMREVLNNLFRNMIKQLRIDRAESARFDLTNKP